MQQGSLTGGCSLVSTRDCHVPTPTPAHQPTSTHPPSTYRRHNKVPTPFVHVEHHAESIVGAAESCYIEQLLALQAGAKHGIDGSTRGQ